MNIDLSVFDPKSRSVALYFLDWDSSGREQRVELIDSIGQVVDQYTVKDFAKGRYLVLNVQGICAIRITRVAGPNAVLNGIFWDPAPAELNAPAPVPLQNTMVEHGILQFTIQGQPGQRICVDISEDLREWECTETYDFHQTSVLVTRAIGQGTRAEFMRTHFVEE